MLVLGLDTATAVCAVGLVQDGELLAELAVGDERGHASRLLPLVAEVLQRAGRSRRDLDGIAAGVGPGSFTGLRIGLATAKAMAYALNRPAVGVCTLDAIAWGIKGYCSPLIDARRGDVYAALYLDGVRLRGPELVPKAAWLERLPRGERVAFPPPLPRGRAVALLGEAALARGEGGDPARLEPLYLRRSEAEVLWEKRQGKEGNGGGTA